MIGEVGSALAIPGGCEEVDEVVVVPDGDVGPAEVGAGFLLEQAAMSAAAAVVPTPSRASRLMASRLVSRPSTWSVAISSAT